MTRRPPSANRLPLWLKVGWTACAAVILPVYAVHYGPSNFLWFSDIALIGSVVALWLEHRLLAGTMALLVLLPDAAWNVDFLAQLTTGHTVLGLASYMWDRGIPLPIRLLSLFHIALPIILVYCVHRLGYDRRALPAATAVAWIVFPVTWALTGPDKNINWVYGFGESPSAFGGWMPQPVYIAALMAGFPLLVYLPTHSALAWWRGQLSGR